MKIADRTREHERRSRPRAPVRQQRRRRSAARRAACSRTCVGFGRRVDDRRRAAGRRRRPAPNQARPLCVERRPRLRERRRRSCTRRSASTTQASAPSISSARRSDARAAAQPASQPRLLQRDPVLADDRLRPCALFCTQRDELLRSRRSRRAARDHPEVAHAAGTGRTWRCAGCTRRPCRARACTPVDEVERDVADRVAGRSGPPAARGRSRPSRGALASDADVEPMKIFWNASCVPEAAVRTTRSIVPRDRRAGDLAPVAHLAGEDRLDLRLREVGDRVRRVGDDADRVVGDLVEDEAARIARLRVARGVADRDAAGGDVGDADVRAALRRA